MDNEFSNISRAKIMIKDFILSGRKLSKAWNEDVEIANALNNEAYPTNIPSFDEMMSELLEWAETSIDNLDAIVEENKDVPITYSWIKYNIGWRLFSDIAKSVDIESDKYKELKDQDIIIVKMKEAVELGFIGDSVK
jgi:hypothetical protein